MLGHANPYQEMISFLSNMTELWYDLQMETTNNITKIFSLTGHHKKHTPRS